MNTDLFESRHIGPSSGEINKMLKSLEVGNLSELIDETIPKSIQLKKPLDLPEGMSENSFLKHIKEVGEKNKIFQFNMQVGNHPQRVRNGQLHI